MLLKNNEAEDKYFISLKGEIDQHNCQKLRDHLDNIILKSNKTKIVFDFSDVSFMDSTGIGIILGRYKKFKNTKEFYIENANPTVDKILKLSGIYSIIPQI